jgi:glycosyltransferase involved in cell wall biosynthesis
MNLMNAPACWPARDKPMSHKRFHRDTRPMRIAVIGCRGVPSNYSGIERIVENLFGHFASNGHRVSVFCRPSIQRQDGLVLKGIRQVFTPAPGGKNGETVTHSILSALHACMFGDAVDGSAPFDLISMHAIAPNLALPIARAAGVPVISHVHGLDWQREKWKGLGARIIHQGERAMARHATAVVVVNKALQQYYRDEYALNTTLLPNGIHTTPDSLEFDRETLQKFGLTPGKFIACIGRLVPEKRLLDTIAAFARLKSDYKLAIVGDGSSVPDHVEKLRTAGAACGNVVFTGSQNGAALETLFRAAAFYVTASELEGLPSSLLECLERGTAAIASDIPPHQEILAGVDGYDLFFDVGDVDRLTGLMRSLIDSPERARTIGAAGRTFVRREYAWPVLAAKTEEFYRQTLARVRACEA